MERSADPTMHHHIQPSSPGHLLGAWTDWSLLESMSTSISTSMSVYGAGDDNDTVVSLPVVTIVGLISGGDGWGKEMVLCVLNFVTVVCARARAAEDCEGWKNLCSVCCRGSTVSGAERGSESMPFSSSSIVGVGPWWRFCWAVNSQRSVFSAVDVSQSQLQNIAFTAFMTYHIRLSHQAGRSCIAFASGCGDVGARCPSWCIQDRRWGN